jgi:hypothetical protein
MAKRKSPDDESHPARSVRDEFYPRGQKRAVLVRIQVEFSRTGRLLRYSLVLIDTQNQAADNGRVLGYVNAHGYHHRHHLGKVEPVEFQSYEDILKYRQYLSQD